MSKKQKKSVLVDLSDAGNDESKQRKYPKRMLFALMLLVLLGLVLVFFPRPAVSSVTVESDVSNVSTNDSVAVVADEGRVQSLAVTAKPAEREGGASLVDSVELASDEVESQTSELVALEVVTIRSHLAEILRISEVVASAAPSAPVNRASSALAFQLDNARTAKAPEASVHLLENEYAQALANETIELLRDNLEHQVGIVESEKLENYAALEWQQFTSQLASATQMDLGSGAYEVLREFYEAHNLAATYNAVALQNIKALAKRSENAGETAASLGLYQDLLVLDAGDAEAIAYLHHHAYPAGGHLHTAPAGIKMRIIPAGEYVQGTPELEFLRDPDETLHAVKITKAFYIAETEVTQKQWLAVMGELPSLVLQDQASRGDQLPIHSVNWMDAVEFCEKLSALSGTTTYRLPTEAEWEIACRSGERTPYNNGTDQLTLEQANIFDPNSTESFDHPVAVASYEPNQWGLYDMHGNVWEWTSDWMVDYSELSTVDPSTAELESGDENLRTKVLRGGSYYDEAGLSRSGNRWSYGSSVATGYIGFRIACTATY